MVVNTLGARVGARASALDANFRLPTLREAAYVLLAIFGLGAAAVLFLGGVFLSNPSRSAVSGFAAELDCTSLGRGGVYCAPRPAVDGQSKAGLGQEDDCVSLGKAGRVCAERR